MWLPRETQLREALAATFRCLRQADGLWHVDLEVNGVPATVGHPDAEEAYARALLHLITGEI